MQYIRLGRTNLHVSRSGFGAIPIQRISFDEARAVLRKAYDGGVNFFDTAHGYSNSEEKIGYALSDVRDRIIIATKSPSKTRQGVMQDIETSLTRLKTDYLDLLQTHNPDFVPQPGGADGIYDALSDAKAQGKIRFIGLTNHRLPIALKAVESGRYDTIQFPLNYLSDEQDLALIEQCRQHDLGVIAMKALSGGLITNAAPTFAFLRQYDNLVPIWGIERLAEIEEFLALEQNPPVLDEAMWEIIKRDRAELSGNYCRGCGYCMPCPVGIPIHMAARMDLAVRRMVTQHFLSDEWKANMERIADCIECGQCRERCPYGLDTPNILKRQLVAYREFYARHA